MKLLFVIALALCLTFSQSQLVVPLDSADRETLDILVSMTSRIPYQCSSDVLPKGVMVKKILSIEAQYTATKNIRVTYLTALGAQIRVQVSQTVNPERNSYKLSNLSCSKV